MKTIQDAKAYLSRYREACAELERLHRERERLAQLRTFASCRLDNTPVQGGPAPSPNAASDSLMDLEREIAAETARLYALRREITAAIRRVPDSTCRILLRWRYIEGLSFEKLAQQMHYSERGVYKVHRRALCLLAKTILA